MSSDTEICNLALSHLGVGKEISDLETEDSQEAAGCRIFFSTARDEILRHIQRPFATTIEALALVENNPNNEWRYSYRYPSNAISIRRILSGYRNDTRQSRSAYRLGFDTSGRLIYSDEQTASIEYTYKITDPGLFSSDFVFALSYRLAMLLAPRLTGGDPFKLQERMEAQYRSHLERAAVNAFNEEQVDLQVESEFIRTREGYRENVRDGLYD